MGSFPYRTIFEIGKDSLKAGPKRTRLTFEEYFLGLSKGHRGPLAARFRLLARYFNFKPDNWPLAFDRLFSMKYPDAQRTINGYRAWHNLREAKNKAFRGGYMFLKLSRLLRCKGVIDWEFRHIKGQQADQRWGLCPASYRRHAEQFFREGRARNLAKGTLWILSNDLTIFGLFLARKKLSHLKLSYENAVSWFEEVAHSGIPPTSINRKLLIIRRFYNWLIARRVLRISPFETLRAVRVPSKLPEILNEKQMRALIQGTDHPRDRAMLEVLYSSGARIGDLRAMDLPNVNFEERTAKTIVKGSHESILYLNESALKALRDYIPVRQAILDRYNVRDQPALFLNLWGRRFSSHGIRAAVRKAGLSALPGVYVHTHMIRHSFATHLLNRGADLFSLMQFLGHKNIQSTIRYLQVATARLSDVHRKYHPRR